VSIARMALLIAFVSVAAHAAEPPDRLLQVEIESLAAKLTDGVATLDHADTYFGANRTPFSDHVIVLLALTSWGGGNGNSSDSSRSATTSTGRSSTSSFGRIARS